MDSRRCTAHHGTPGGGLALSTASRLEQRIARSAERVLPTLTRLCAEYRVSRPTMLAAVHLLRDRGILEYRRGQRILVASEVAEAGAPERVPSYSVLARSIEEGISGATFRSGQVLPKVRFLASSHRVSDRTVVAALRALASENRIHKRGRSWVVGPCPRSGLNVFVRAPATLLLLQSRPQSWLGISSQERTERFSQAFSMEAQNHHVQIVPVLTDEVAAPRGTIVAGPGGIDQLVRQLGGRYIGTLVVGEQELLAQHDGLVSRLLTKGRPLVWFDKHDTGHTARPGSKLYTRCHFCERNALVLALDFLAEMGHTRVAYLNNNDYDKGAWSHRRGALLAEAAAALHPSLSIVTRQPRVAWWNEMSESALAGLLRTQHRCGPPNVRTAIDTLVSEGLHGGRSSPYRRLASVFRSQGVPGKDLQRHFQIVAWAPVITPYLHDPATTAFIAPRDYDAAIFYFWLRSAGLDMPGDYSLISFDNYPLLSLYPVTTIDFGFGYLGYTAFHTILGDIPIRRDRNGDVASQPAIIRRGSVGPPPETTRRVYTYQ